MNLQELIDKPGYGSATAIIKEAGYWRLGALEVLHQVPDDECSDQANGLIDDAIAILEQMEHHECT